MFFGLLDPDPDPLIRGPDPVPDPSIIKQKLQKNKFLLFCEFFMTFIFEKLCKCVSKSNVSILKVTTKIPESGAGVGSGSESVSQRIRGSEFESKCHGSATLVSCNGI
jgi:hypothetical protein